MNSKRLKVTKRTANKGLSPVIAAVILIAVTVAIAVAAGGYFFGLFGTQTSRAAVSIRSTTLALSTDGAAQCTTGADIHVLQLELQNAGGLADSISAVSMAGATSGPTIALGNTTSIGANVGSFTTMYCVTAPFTTGQTVSFSLRLGSGLTVPVAVSVS